LKTVLLPAALLLACVGATSAADFPLTIANKSSADVTGFSVQGGKVAGFKQVRSSQSRQVTVSLADGTCEAGLRLTFSDGSDLDYSRFDFCNIDTLPIEDDQ
jgi:hypothetical protein